ncbi:hypothetical protein DL770_009039 [Monosporascus sp. CRB-9-2]|nr:hypothetical protein DL770_009039 [Monosporascus sp. CRB-9-2]
MMLSGILRRSQLGSIRHHGPISRRLTAAPLLPSQNLRTLQSRSATTSTKTETAAEQPPARKFAYPERLCIYHAGTGRTTFLACLKLSTLFIFAFFGFVVTPAYFDKEGFSVNVARTTASALVPLVFVAYTTSPFVSFIHIRLPPFARQSEEMLRRFVQSLPPKTELDITTMSFIAKPRLSKVAVSDLRAANKRLGIVNYTRDTAAENAARKWYMFPAVGNFSIQGNKMPRLPWVWEHVANTLARQRA